jgi:hypothetical protein
MIRRFADGELDLNQRLAMERALEQSTELRRVLAFERELRTRVARVMHRAAPTAPAGLHQKIAQALQEMPETADAAAILANITPDPSKDAVMAPRRSPLTRPNVFAMAASLALVAGAVLFGIYGTPIDRWRLGNTAGVAPITEITEFVTRAHDQLAGNAESREKTLCGQSCQDACSNISKQFGCPKEVPSIDLHGLGYEWIGHRELGIPHYQKSAQLVFHRTDPDRPPAMASVFVGFGRMIEAEKVAEPGSWTTMPLSSGCTHVVYLSSDGSIDYLLVCCDAGDMDRLAEAIGEQLVASCGGSTALTK